MPPPSPEALIQRQKELADKAGGYPIEDWANSMLEWSAQAADALASSQEALRAAERARDEARGAIAAQGEREQQAGERCGVPTLIHGCDWPDAVAEKVIAQRSALQAKEQEIAEAKRTIVEYAREVAALRSERDILKMFTRPTWMP